MIWHIVYFRALLELPQCIQTSVAQRRCAGNSPFFLLLYLASIFFFKSWFLWVAENLCHFRFPTLALGLYLLFGLACMLLCTVSAHFFLLPWDLGWPPQARLLSVPSATPVSSGEHSITARLPLLARVRVLCEAVLGCRSGCVHTFYSGIIWPASAVSEKVVCLPPSPAPCPSCVSRWKEQDRGRPAVLSRMTITQRLLKTREKFVSVLGNYPVCLGWWTTCFMRSLREPGSFHFIFPPSFKVRLLLHGQSQTEAHSCFRSQVGEKRKSPGNRSFK